MMTGYPGIFAGGDMIAGENSVTDRRRSRQEGGARTSTPGCARRITSAVAKAPVVTFDMLHLPIYSDADPSPQRTLEAAGADQRLRGGRAAA